MRYALLLVLCAGCAHAQPPEAVPASIRFVDLRPIVPGAVIRGVWEEVGHCLHRGGDLEPEVVRWGTASVIVDLAGKQRLWGVVAYVYWPEGTALTAVVEESVRDNTRVWSHEIGHVLGVPDGDWRLDACTLDLDAPYALPPRPLTDEQIAALRSVS